VVGQQSDSSEQQDNADSDRDHVLAPNDEIETGKSRKDDDCDHGYSGERASKLQLGTTLIRDRALKNAVLLAASPYPICDTIRAAWAAILLES
jgi:hypothetical protein